MVCLGALIAVFALSQPFTLSDLAQNHSRDAGKWEIHRRSLKKISLGHSFYGGWKQRLVFLICALVDIQQAQILFLSLAAVHGYLELGTLFAGTRGEKSC